MTKRRHWAPSAVQSCSRGVVGLCATPSVCQLWCWGQWEHQLSSGKWLLSSQEGPFLSDWGLQWPGPALRQGLNSFEGNIAGNGCCTCISIPWHTCVGVDGQAAFIYHCSVWNWTCQGTLYNHPSFCPQGSSIINSVLYGNRLFLSCFWRTGTSLWKNQMKGFWVCQGLAFTNKLRDWTVQRWALSSDLSE